jgi:D-arabinose 1-dehydrogenase-like Zn-dependent alcohol dehydrogenase
MRSWQLVEFGAPLAENLTAPPPPQGTEVLLRVRACGACHSDVHLWQGYFDLGGGKKLSFADTMKLPFTLGHEICGEVSAAGPDSGMVSVGSKWVVFPWIGCGKCDMCLSDREHCCIPRQSIGTKRHGGFSEYVLVPHPRYLIEYEDVPDALAATYACSGLTAYSALKKVSGLGSSEWLLLIGAGGVGLSAINIAPLVTKARVLVADVNAERRRAALAAGAEAVVDNSLPGALAEIKGLTGGQVWGVIDFVGRPETAQLGLDALHRGGALIVVGLHGGALSLPLATVPPRMLTIRGSQVGTLAEMRELMELARAGRVPAIPIETRPMSRASETLEDLHAGRITGRVVLHP